MDLGKYILSITKDISLSQRIPASVGGGGCGCGLVPDKLFRAKEIYDNKYPLDEVNPSSQRIVFLGSRQLNYDLAKYYLEKDVARNGFREFLGFTIVLVDFLDSNHNGNREIVVMRVDAIGSLLFLPMEADLIKREDILIIECDES